jgi:hypothetical protein
MAGRSTDNILIEARNTSIQLEGLAANDLAANLDSYLGPSFSARQVVRGYREYITTGKTSQDNYLMMRKTFSETKGQSNRVFSDVLSTHVKTRKYDCSKTLFQVNTNDWNGFVRSAANALVRDGYWKAKFLVPERLVNSLKQKCISRLEASYGDQVEACMRGAKNGPVQLKSSQEWLLTCEEMYEIAADPLWLSIVQQYLGVPPIFNTPVVFLNSNVEVTSDKDLSDVAQLYHHDMHRLRFLKLFIYLTDVDAGAGPHAMLRKTHRVRPDALWEDGRHTDQEVEDAGLMEDEARITGPAGTIFLVDTSALHKGLHPEKKSRLMAQVQYTNSLFGWPIPDVEHKVALSHKSDNEDVQTAAELVRKYAQKCGVRFMQHYI